MLTEFQERLARIILSSSPDPELALAGGAALIAREIVQRATVDLDFFTTAGHVPEVVAALVEVLERAGMVVRLEQVSEHFARLTVSERDEECRVDIAQDARMTPAERTSLGPMLTAEELAADKMLALFTRAEPRDYVDVYFLAAAISKERLLDLAKQKDRGFDTRVFAGMLGAISRLDRDEFEADDATLERMNAFYARWGGSLERLVDPAVCTPVKASPFGTLPGR